MRIVKVLKFVEGEGFEKIMQYKKNIELRKKDVEGTEKLFNNVEEQILNGEYEKAKEGFERIFYEEIPPNAVMKMSQLDQGVFKDYMKTWCQDFICKGEIGFHMLIYQYI